MGAPGSGMKAAEQPAAETLLSAFKTIALRSGASTPACSTIGCRFAATRNSRRSTISIRSKSPTPAPTRLLLELISGGHDAEIRHLGEALKD